MPWYSDANRPRLPVLWNTDLLLAPGAKAEIVFDREIARPVELVFVDEVRQEAWQWSLEHADSHGRPFTEYEDVRITSEASLTRAALNIVWKAESISSTDRKRPWMLCAPLGATAWRVAVAWGYSPPSSRFEWAKARVTAFITRTQPMFDTLIHTNYSAEFTL